VSLPCLCWRVQLAGSIPVDLDVTGLAQDLPQEEHQERLHHVWIGWGDLAA
jgi:hypothetical protein